MKTIVQKQGFSLTEYSMGVRVDHLNGLRATHSSVRQSGGKLWQGVGVSAITFFFVVVRWWCIMIIINVY